MAISLAKHRRVGQQRTTAKRLAAEFEGQQKKAQKRKGWSSLLGGVGGKLLGGALATMTGGLGIPLVLAASNMLAKKAAHELTRGMGASTAGLKADEYGYGASEAQTLKGALQAEMAVDPLKEHGGFGKELLSASIGAGLEGKLGDPLKNILEVGTGDAGSITSALANLGIKGATEVAGQKGSESLLPTPQEPIGQTDYSIGETAFTIDPLTGEMIQNNAQGGQVMDRDQLLELIALSESMNQTSYDNTPLEESQPTIAEMFQSQGKTLGGSNTKSLSQMLGR